MLRTMEDLGDIFTQTISKISNGDKTTKCKEEYTLLLIFLLGIKNENYIDN